MVAPAIIAGGLGLLGSLFSSRAANRATQAGVDASQQQMDLFRQVYGDQQEFMQPYREAGQQGLNQYQNALAGGPNLPGAGYNYGQMAAGGAGLQGLLGQLGQGFSTPGGAYSREQIAGGRQALGQALGQLGTPYEQSDAYRFQLEQGQNAIDNSAASSGNLFSGATLKAQQQYGQGLAAQDYDRYQNQQTNLINSLIGGGLAGQGNLMNARNAYDNRQTGIAGALMGQGNYGQQSLANAQGNYLNRLQGMAAMGQNAAANQGAAAAQFGQMGGTALGNMGQSQMTGAIAQGNAINLGIDNALSAYGYLTQA